MPCWRGAGFGADAFAGDFFAGVFAAARPVLFAAGGFFAVFVFGFVLVFVFGFACTFFFATASTPSPFAEDLWGISGACFNHD